MRSDTKFQVSRTEPRALQCLRAPLEGIVAEDGWVETTSTLEARCLEHRASGLRLSDSPLDSSRGIAAMRKRELRFAAKQQRLVPIHSECALGADCEHCRYGGFSEHFVASPRNHNGAGFHEYDLIGVARRHRQILRCEVTICSRKPFHIRTRDGARRLMLLGRPSKFLGIVGSSGLRVAGDFLDISLPRGPHVTVPSPRRTAI